MDIEFEADKDAVNIDKHGVSLARAADLDILIFLADDRADYGETRYRAWGLIDGNYHCLAFTWREGRVRAVSLRGRTKRRSTAMSRKIESDRDNPVWSRKDFAKARPASELPAELRRAFPRTRGTQVAPKKVPVSIRLSAEVIERFKATGPGWQTRIDEALKKVVGL